MNNRLLILVLSALLLPVFASAQSISEIEAAKAMAKSYGYSESEIEALLNDPSKARSQSEAVTLETSQEPEGVIQLKQAKKDEETEIDKTKQIFGHDFFSSKGLTSLGPDQLKNTTRLVSESSTAAYIAEVCATGIA